MVSILELAKYIVEEYGSINIGRLQKYCYYVQVWSIAWERGVVFPEPIEVWTNGPVVRDLYNATKDKYSIYPADFPNIDDTAVRNNAILTATIKDVLTYYRQFYPQQLEDLVHVEKPFINNAYKNCEKPKILSLEEIKTYYQSLIERNKPFKDFKRTTRP